MSWLPVIITSLVIALVGMYALRDREREIVVPPPDTLRTDLLYGYYTSHGEQVAETAGHVNLYWESFWRGIDRAIDDIRAAAMTTVIDVDGYVFSGLDVRPDAEAHVRELFTQLRAAGVLHHVRVIVPCDEPNLGHRNVLHHLPTVVPMLRRVAAEFTEMDGVMLGVIYALGKRHEHVELFDIVGADDYGQRSRVLAPGGIYDRLRERLRPDQKLWLVPGGYRDCKQDPAPFINYAHTHADVWAVVPFLWADMPWGPFAGIRSLPDMRPLYEAAGRQIVGAVNG